VLKGQTPAFIKQSIVTPNAVIAKGYPANVMPQNFAQQLSAAQINGLVAYLSKVTK
jgi:cytochrome c oxidase subunit II